MDRGLDAHRISFRLTVILLLGALPLAAVGSAAAADAPALSELHTALVAAYLDGKWVEAETMLTGKSKELAALTDAKEKANVTYIRQAMAECRPAWWKTCKAGQHATFQAMVWGRPTDIIYEPGAKPTMQMHLTNLKTTATIVWPAAEMDDPAIAEHGFSKGDLCDLNIWASMGTADAYSVVSVRAQAGMDEAGRLLVGLFAAFRGNLTGAYYGTPRARRWDMWLDLAAHGDQSGKAKDVMVRRAVASAFMAEVLAHPERYPSIHLPAALAADSAEEKLAAELKPAMEKHDWTLPEDRALRDAFKAMGMTNVKDVWRTGVVQLGNGQTVALDADKDADLQVKRNAWVSGAFEKARGK